LVAESGRFGLYLLPPLVVVPGAAVAAGRVAVEIPGAVTAGMETDGAALSPELSLPQPVIASPTTTAASGMNRPRGPLTRIRRVPAGAVRSRGSR
jgi:hypothetical protein